MINDQVQPAVLVVGATSASCMCLIADYIWPKFWFWFDDHNHNRWIMSTQNKQLGHLSILEVSQEQVWSSKVKFDQNAIYSISLYSSIYHACNGLKWPHNVSCSETVAAVQLVVCLQRCWCLNNCYPVQFYRRIGTFHLLCFVNVLTTFWEKNC